MSDNTDDANEEYRPTDYLAVCGMSWGIGFSSKDAMLHALRYEGPFDPDGEPVEVGVWELYADSWKSHGLSGPESGAEQLSFRRYDIPREKADQVSRKATNVFAGLSSALGDAELLEEVDGPHGTDD